MIQNRDGALGLDKEEPLPWLEPVDDFDDKGQPSPARLMAMMVGGLILIGAVLTILWWYQNGGPRGQGDLILAEKGDYKIPPAHDGAKIFEGEGDAAFAASEGMLTGGNVDPNRLPEEPAVTPEERAAAAEAAKKAQAEAQLAARAANAPKDANSGAPQAPENGAKSGDAPANRSAEKKAPTPRPVVTPTPARQVPASGTVQLGAFSSEGAANKAWINLSKRFAYLADYNRSIAPAKVGDKTVYRLRIGVGSPANADGLCQKLRVAGEGCVIVR